jgi:hypothetical protein
MSDLKIVGFFCYSESGKAVPQPPPPAHGRQLGSLIRRFSPGFHFSVFFVFFSRGCDISTTKRAKNPGAAWAQPKTCINGRSVAPGGDDTHERDFITAEDAKIPREYRKGIRCHRFILDPHILPSWPFFLVVRTVLPGSWAKRSRSKRTKK